MTNNKKVIAVFSDDTKSDITDEFNHTQHSWKWSFVELAESVRESMGAIELKFV